MEDSEVYFTPPHIADFVTGSGSFLQAVTALITNPPYQGGDPNNEMKLTQSGSARSEDVSSDEDLFDDIVGW